MKTDKFLWMMVFLVPLLISSCGGGTTDGQGSAGTYTVGGSVSALLYPGLVLQNNGGDDLVITPNGASFTFSSEVVDGGSYNVSVKSHPAMQFGYVTQGSGIISGASVTDVLISCTVGIHIVR
jgi:hypothetical protein